MKSLALDIARVLLLVLCTGGYLYYSDPANMLLIEVAVAGVFLSGISHITRKVMFYRVDLQSLLNKAAETSVGAAIAAVAMVLLFMSFLAVPLLVLK